VSQGVQQSLERRVLQAGSCLRKKDLSLSVFTIFLSLTLCLFILSFSQTAFEVIFAHVHAAILGVCLPVNLGPPKHTCQAEQGHLSGLSDR